MTNSYARTDADIKSQAINEIVAQISVALGYPADKPPVQVNDKQAAQALCIKASTLSVWRSTGRYNLPFIKVGRLVRYRVNDLAQFLADRTARHTDEVA